METVVKIWSQKNMGTIYEAGERKLNIYPVALFFLINIAAWPLIYLFNSFLSIMDVAMRPYALAVSANSLVFLIPWILQRISRGADMMYTVVSLSAFISMTGVMLILDRLGLLSNIISEYIEHGEPYLKTSWGTAVLVCDFVVIYPITILLAYLTSNGGSWRSVGLYWASAFVTKKSVTLFGYASGSLSFTPCMSINFITVALGATAFVSTLRREEPSMSWKSVISTDTLIFTAIIDCILVLGLGASCFAIAIKAGASLGSTSNVALGLIQHEPVLRLNEPAPYATIQVLLCMLYVVPAQILSLYYFLFQKTKPGFLWDLSLFQAGVVIQAQFTYMILALHPGTPATSRTDPRDPLFWALNVMIALVPQLLVYRLSLHRRYLKRKEG